MNFYGENHWGSSQIFNNLNIIKMVLTLLISPKKKICVIAADDLAKLNLRETKQADSGSRKKINF